MTKSLDKNKLYNQEFFSLVRGREKENQEELLELKIKLAENRQLHKEQEQLNKNWQRRFNNLSQQHIRLKEFFIQEQNKLQEDLKASNKNVKEKENQLIIDEAKDFSVDKFEKILRNKDIQRYTTTIVNC